MLTLFKSSMAIWHNSKLDIPLFRKRPQSSRTQGRSLLTDKIMEALEQMRRGEGMNRRRFILSMVGAFLIGLFGRKIAWANKAETKIEAPEGVGKGSEITIRVTVIHNANNFFHHIEWLWIRVNEKEIARWDFTATNRPEEATFTRQIKYQVEGDSEIKSKASCNIHGSGGEAEARVLAKV